MDEHFSSIRPPQDYGDSQLVIRALYEIAGEYDKGLDHQVKRILELGLKRFDLDIGILSNIQDANYTVIKQVTPEDVPLNDGDAFQLGNTYCSITLAANGPVGFEHVAESEISTHPAYRSFGLEAYIGVPVHVRGEPYGTLNFSSPNPRPRVFSDVDIDALRLMAAWVGSELSRRQTEEELKQAKVELELQSREDPLTHLYNRRGLEEKLVRMTRRSRFHGPDLIAMVIDVDDFKSINDDYSHSTGDRVLEAIAETISNSVRPNDICARVGGDEFIVLLADCLHATAEKVAMRIRESVNALRIQTPATTVRPAVSIGAGPVPEDARTVTEVLAALCPALQRVKVSGKNAVSF